MSVTIDLRGVNAAFKSAPSVFLSEMSRGAKEGLTDIQRDARSHHKFHRKSGNLQRSVVVDFKSFSEPGKGIRLESGLAPYANRIHEGYEGKTDKIGRRFHGPKPDQFLYEAAARGEKSLVNRITKGIGRAIIKIGFKVK